MEIRGTCEGLYPVVFLIFVALTMGTSTIIRVKILFSCNLQNK